MSSVVGMTHWCPTSVPTPLKGAGEAVVHPGRKCRWSQRLTECENTGHSGRSTFRELSRSSLDIANTLKRNACKFYLHLHWTVCSDPASCFCDSLWDTVYSTLSLSTFKDNPTLTCSTVFYIFLLHINNLLVSLSKRPMCKIGENPMFPLMNHHE